LNKKNILNSISDSKNVLLTLLDKLPQVFWLASVKGTNKIEYVSPSFENITGHKTDEIYKNPNLWIDLILEEDRNRVLSVIERFTHGEEEYKVTYRIVRKDGTIRWISQKSFLVKDSNGKIEKLAGISEDITDKIEYEKKAKENEETIQSLYKAVPLGMGVVINRTFTFVNDTFCDMLGYSREELIGNNSRMIYPTDEDYEYVGREKYALLEKYGSGNVETRFKTKNGDILNVILSSARVDSKNPSKGTIFATIDITNIKKAEKKAKENEETIQSLYKAVPLGMGVVINRYYTFVNDTFCDMLGYSREELLGNNTRMMYATDEDYKYSGSTNYGSGSIETRLKTKKGNILNVILSSAKIDQSDPDKGVIFAILNITDRKKAEERIRILNDNLKLLNKILRHDISNDLAVISFSLETLDTKNEFIKNKAFSAIERSVNLIDNMRKLEKAIGSSENLTSVEIKEIVDKIGKNYPDIEINVTGNCKALADEALIPVIDNIINNAIVHGKTDKVDISIKEIKNSCKIKISDYGEGIPDEIKGEIFKERFGYGANRGSGLGLYIAKKTIERYEGEISVEDTKPRGATFLITLRKYDSAYE
jgi:PAS domain S-box-containing protein